MDAYSFVAHRDVSWGCVGPTAGIVVLDPLVLAVKGRMGMAAEDAVDAA